MGALCGALYWSRRLRSGALSELEKEFGTGDIVLFAGIGSNYLTKVGRWSGFSDVGFLIRQKPGVEGLSVCHCGAQERKSSSGGGSSARRRVKVDKFARYINRGNFNVVVVRKLRNGLTAEEEMLVEQFAQESCGKVLNQRVSLLMASDSVADECPYCCCILGCFEPNVERFFCSELVVTMLERVNRVVRDNNVYIARGTRDSREGRLLMPPVSVQVPGRRAKVGAKSLLDKEDLPREQSWREISGKSSLGRLTPPRRSISEGGGSPSGKSHARTLSSGSETSGRRDRSKAESRGSKTPPLQ